MQSLTDTKEESKCSSATIGSRAWFAVFTKARQEHVAAENLVRQGFEAYCPNIAFAKRKNGKVIRGVEPFFPRYIFLRLDLDRDNWGPVRCTRGVSGLVRFGGIPRQVPSCLISALKSNENGGQLQIMAPRLWKQGDTIEIEQGPFAGYSCIFQSQRSADRVAVLLKIAGRATQATLLHRDIKVLQFA